MVHFVYSSWGVLCTQLVTSDHSSDVTGVEIAGALKNVLAIAAGIVDGMQLGNNSMAALVSQGCSEIRWLATKVVKLIYVSIYSFIVNSTRLQFLDPVCLACVKMGAKPTTITGLSGTGDIMLTCFVNLSRNRTVGVRLGSGETLDEILSSMNQVCVSSLVFLSIGETESETLMNQ